MALAPLAVAQDPPRDQSVGDLSHVRTINVDRGLTGDGRECIDCHKTINPGILND